MDCPCWIALEALYKVVRFVEPNNVTVLQSCGFPFCGFLRPAQLREVCLAHCKPEGYSGTSQEEHFDSIPSVVPLEKTLSALYDA